VRRLGFFPERRIRPYRLTFGGEHSGKRNRAAVEGVQLRDPELFLPRDRLVILQSRKRPEIGDDPEDVASPLLIVTGDILPAESRQGNESNDSQGHATMVQDGVHGFSN
jgi:hypothetical protein